MKMLLMGLMIGFSASAFASTTTYSMTSYDTCAGVTNPGVSCAYPEAVWHHVRLDSLKSISMDFSTPQDLTTMTAADSLGNSFTLTLASCKSASSDKSGCQYLIYGADETEKMGIGIEEWANLQDGPSNVAFHVVTDAEIAVFQDGIFFDLNVQKN